MKPLAARACARPLTAPSTMALLEQPNHARCAIQLPDPPFSTERARSRSSAGYRPATLPLDSLVGSLAARPIASLGPPLPRECRFFSPRRKAEVNYNGGEKDRPFRQDQRFKSRFPPTGEILISLYWSG